MKNVYIYDIEVFKEDYLVCAINYRNPEERHHAWSGDTQALLQLKALFLNTNNMFGGFNNKHYDDYIVKAILRGASTEEVKAYNDFIIGGGQPWEYPVDYGYKKFLSFDLRDDLPINLSLKAIEGNLRLPIVESSVPFDIDRALTPEEREEVLRYCWHDVESTHKLMTERTPYLLAKYNVATMKGNTWPERTMGMGLTNAKLTAMYLEAQGDAPTDDEREYIIPSNLNLDRIPKEVLDFFGKLKDTSIPDEELFKSKLNLKFEDMEIVYAFGGLHASLSNCDIRANENLVIWNWDVGSMYPSMMINNHLVSRAVARPGEYKQVRDDRIEAKHRGDKKKADALKLVLNTAYGAMLNKYNKLYDPLMARSVCITGQLYLTDLIFGLKGACKTFRGLNFNTDGVMFSIHPSEYEASMEVINEWQARTGLTLEGEEIIQYTAKDVNNYIVVHADGSTKAIGGYVSLHKGGSIKSNNMVIVDKAVYNYFVNGTAPEDTINGSTDIFEFQIIAKCGGKYEKATWMVNGEHKDVQRVNRIYASRGSSLGTLYKWKLKGDDLRPEQIANLPEHCLVDNENNVTVDDIDKQFYIDEAKKRIAAYIGEEPVKKVKRKATKPKTTKESKRRTVKRMKPQDMETVEVHLLGHEEPTEVPIEEPIPLFFANPEVTHIKQENIGGSPSLHPNVELPKVNLCFDKETILGANIHAKLSLARLQFDEYEVPKSGRNGQNGSCYFELRDIVPVASRILYNLGLIFEITFTDKFAVGTLVNMSVPDEEPIVFQSPLVNIDNTLIDAVKYLGNQQNHQRRCLYMMLLDIVDNDVPVSADHVGTSILRQPPACTPVTDVQKGEVKKLLLKLRELGPMNESYIHQVVQIMKGNPSSQQAQEIIKDLVNKTKQAA